VVILDKAYSHPSARQAMRERGIRMICPERDNQTAPPDRERLTRRTATHLRPGALQAAQRGRTLLQPARTVPRPGHPLRQRTAHYQASLTIAAIIL
jgi:hypothetical protein